MILKNIFKKKKKLGWQYMTVRQWLQIEDILNEEGDELYKSVEFLKILTGKDYSIVPLAEYMEKVKELSFLQDDMPTIDTPKTVTINGREHDVVTEPDNITTAQFMDYMTHTKAGGKDLLPKICMTFLIPKGHKYGEGYDFVDVLNDVYDMPFIEANSIAFFLPNQSKRLWKRSQFFLRCQILMMKGKTMREKWELIKDIDTLSLTMESFRI